MTLEDAVAAVEATLVSPQLRVDRKRAQADADAYLLLVLDTSGGRPDGPVDNGPRLVDRRTVVVTRLTVADALASAESMAPARG